MTESIPYGRHEIDDDDIAAVTAALRSSWLTTGPLVAEFEDAFARFCGSPHAVAVNSGTAALHAAVGAAQLGPGDEVIVPAITFAATANAAIYEGATPVFADVEPDTLLIDPRSVERLIGPRTRAIIAVDYAGQAADYDALYSIVDSREIAIIADACHSPGGSYRGRMVGSLADLSTFSFHPVKHVTTCEGGMVTTSNADFAARMRRFRNHGIDSDHRSRGLAGTFAYDMVELGYNYRLPDVQCALGLSQLKKLKDRISARHALAVKYDKMLAALPYIRPLKVHADRIHAYHLYVVLLNHDRLRLGRQEVFNYLRAKGIGVNVHYQPVYYHSYYAQRFGYGRGICPNAEEAYERILSLPMFPGLSRLEFDHVTGSLNELADIG